MNNKQDARQIISRDTLPKIALSANTQADALLRSIDAEVTQPLYLTPSSPASLIVNVGPSKVSNPATGKVKALPTLGSDTPAITSGTITFPSSSGGNVVLSPGFTRVLTVGSGQWIKGVITLDSNNQLDITFGVAGASESAATAPKNPDGTIAIGYISIQNSAGVIQNISLSNIYQYDTPVPRPISSGSDSLVTQSLPYVIDGSNDNGKAFLIDTSGGSGTITLPSPVLNFRVKIKDITGFFSANPVTVARSSGGIQIENLASDYILEANYGEWTFESDGSNWFIF